MIVIKNVYGGSQVYIKNVFANAENIVVVYNGGEPITITGGGGGSGDVVGPASSTDNAVVRFNGVTGKLVQNSGVTIDDSGNLTANNISGTNTGDQDLSGKSDVGHTHAQSDITNLVTDLAGKAATSHTHTASNITDYYTNDMDKIILSLGSVIKYSSFGLSPSDISSLATFGDSTTYISPVYINKSDTITGVKFYSAVQGNFTGDNTNGIALYSYSGGTLTKVAETANDANIWKGSSNTWQTVAFTSPYSASAGTYFLVILYNNSAQTTAPQIGIFSNLAAAGVSSIDLTNSAKICGYRQTRTTLEATILMSNLITHNIRYSLFLY